MTSLLPSLPTSGRLQMALAAQAYLVQRRRATGGDDLLTWTMKYRIMLSPKTPFDLTSHAYLRGLYECDARQMVVKKAGQVGASEYLVSYALHAADARRMDILYVMPTDDDVSDFSRTRFGPALEASTYLAEIVVDGSADARRGADRVTLKRIHNSWLYFRGGRVKPDGNAPQLKSLPADGIILDEYDEIDVRAPELARKRLGHSAHKEERDVSTPTYTGVGIDLEWRNTDQRLWHLRCDHCGTWQTLTIQQVVIEQDELGRPVDWWGRAEGRAFVACRRCQREMNRLAVGQWVPTFPGRDVAGFHLSKLFSAQANLMSTIRALQTADESKRKEAFNQDLGEPYTPQGGGLTDQALDACRREYAPGARANERTVMGVDVGRVLHFVIRGPADATTGERPLRRAGEAASFDEVGRLIRAFNVGVCVMDALPETHAARKFQGEVNAGRRGTVWLAYYSSFEGTRHEDIGQWNDKEGIVTLDRTRAMDEMMARFTDGKNALPATMRSNVDYYEHLKASVRVTERKRDGNLAARYVESGPDHYAHAETYCAAASLRPRAVGVLAQGTAKGWGI